MDIELNSQNYFFLTEFHQPLYPNYLFESCTNNYVHDMSYD